MFNQGHVYLFALFETLSIPMLGRKTPFQSGSHSLSPSMHSPPLYKASSAYLKSSVSLRQGKSAAVSYPAFDLLFSLLIAIIYFL